MTVGLTHELVLYDLEIFPVSLWGGIVLLSGLIQSCDVVLREILFISWVFASPEFFLFCLISFRLETLIRGINMNLRILVFKFVT